MISFEQQLQKIIREEINTATVGKPRDYQKLIRDKKNSDPF